MTGAAQTADAPLADNRVRSPVSIVIPTYREVDNIPHILARIDRVRRDHDMTLEVLFMDDRSRDGSAEAVAAAGHDWARLVERDGARGLAPAVVDGFRLARYPVLVCMDADLSHPPEAIPQMVLALAAGQQFVIGSRYVPGGATDDDWGFLRWFNSFVATLLARPLTSARDPMSGFFALRKADFDRARDLNPIGYKIGLELIVKCGFENIGEVPIFFADRIHGESKLSLREQLRYVQHIRRLYLHKFAETMHLLQFLVVGASGVVVNFAVITGLLAVGFSAPVCLAGGILVSVVSNFLLNRRFTFSYARHESAWKQFGGFVVATAIAMAVNYAVALAVLARAPEECRYCLYLAALAGIASGMVFNFLGNRFIVFRKRYLRK